MARLPRRRTCLGSPRRPRQPHLSQSFIDVFAPAPEDQGEERPAKEHEYRKALGYAAFFLPAATLEVTGVPPAGLLRWQPLTRFVPNLVTSAARSVVPGFAACSICGAGRPARHG